MKGMPLLENIHLSIQPKFGFVAIPSKMEILRLNSSHPLLIAFHNLVPKDSLTSKVYQPLDLSIFSLDYLPPWAIMLKGMSRQPFS